MRGVGALLIKGETVDDLGAGLLCERLTEVVEQVQILPEPMQVAAISIKRQTSEETRQNNSSEAKKC